MSRENGNPVVTVRAEGPLVKGTRLAARGLATLLLLMVAVFALYEGVPNPFHMTALEWACDGAFLVMVIGLLAGLRYERLGGAVVLVGFLAFTAAKFPISGHVRPGYSVVFAVAGVLYLLARRRGRVTCRG
ncbi:MAG TPA: hypothetical protein PKI11_11520 [Candidatus Hydrogenedentes bacterium]|nr:hypothetical protein [Candidatus Hydrogenedentota bacterium]